jgi:serine/threonine protein phosphatase PrpC
VLKANAVIGPKGAVVAMGDGAFKPTKTLYPTRGFGDADFKEQVKPNAVIIATPTGVGIGHEGPAFELTGPGPYWLLIGCDGLWDFMKEDAVRQTMFAKGEIPQTMAEHLVKTVQGKPFASYDDVTCIVCKIELPA